MADGLAAAGICAAARWSAVNIVAEISGGVGAKDSAEVFPMDGPPGKSSRHTMHWSVSVILQKLTWKFSEV